MKKRENFSRKFCRAHHHLFYVYKKIFANCVDKVFEILYIRTTN